MEEDIGQDLEQAIIAAGLVKALSQRGVYASPTKEQCSNQNVCTSLGLRCAPASAQRVSLFQSFSYLNPLA